MKKKIVSALLCVAMIATMVTGCGGSKSSSTSGNADSTAKQFEINAAIAANPPALDPHTVNANVTGAIGIHIYEALFQMDENYEPQPVLAESYKISDDGKEYTIKLRHGVKFHNGDEMKADDVVASMNRWMKLSPKAKTLIGGSVFEKVDDYTVKLTVNEPSSDIIMVLASPIQFAAIYPKSVVDSASDEGVKEYIGTGPYKVAEWKQDQYVKLEKNEDYQPAKGKSSGLAGAKNAQADTITFNIVTDTATRIAGVQNGQYDIAEDIPADQYKDLAADKNLTMDVRSGGTLNLFLNTTEGVMADEKVRQAALAALNCDDILMASYGDADLYKLNAGWCNPDDAQWGTEAGSEYYNQNDVEKAKKLLSESSYNNEKIVLVTTPEYNDMYNATLVVQEQLKAAGFNAEVESSDFNTFMERRADPKQFSMYITSNSYNMLPIQLSVLDKGWAGLDRPEISDGIKAIRSASSNEEAKAAWEDLQSFIYEYGAASVIGHFTNITAMNSKVENYQYLRFPIYWNITFAE